MQLTKIITVGMCGSLLLQDIPQCGVWDCPALCEAMKGFRRWSHCAFPPLNLHFKRGKSASESIVSASFWAQNELYLELLVWINCCLGCLPWQKKKSHFDNMLFCFLFHKAVFVTVWRADIVKEELGVLIYLILKCHLETFRSSKCWHLDKILLQWCLISELHISSTS